MINYKFLFSYNLAFIVNDLKNKLKMSWFHAEVKIAVVVPISKWMGLVCSLFFFNSACSLIFALYASTSVIELMMLHRRLEVATQIFSSGDPIISQIWWIPTSLKIDSVYKENNKYKYANFLNILYLPKFNTTLSSKYHPEYYTPNGRCFLHLANTFSCLTH